MAIGTWSDQRIGIYRGLRTGKQDYGGTVYADKDNVPLSVADGYNPLIAQIVKFFETRKSPVDDKETLEIYAFMEVADESKRKNGMAVTLDSVLQKA